MAAPRDVAAEGMKSPTIATANTDFFFFSYSSIGGTVTITKVTNAMILGT